MKHTLIPTTVFSGFLGSGKTTIISHMIDLLQKTGEQVIFIKNEIGDENVDGQIMAGKNIKTKELLNGCICCTLVGPFSNAIDEIAANFKPDRIIIEASGAADPSAIALMISSHPKLYRDGVISVIDVLNFAGYKDISYTAQKQARFTDLIIFNKIEDVPLEQKRAVVGYVRELNTHSPIIEAPEGRVHPDVVFGVSTSALDKLLISMQAESETKHEHTHHAGAHSHEHPSHLEQDQIQTFHFTTAGTANPSKLRETIENFPPSVFRVKGFFVDESGQFYLLNKVGLRLDIVEYATQPREKNSIVVIGFAIASQEVTLRKQLESCFSR